MFMTAKEVSMELPWKREKPQRRRKLFLVAGTAGLAAGTAAGIRRLRRRRAQQEGQ
jgi:hypothetical protein